jgi:HEAT repeat protein
MAYGGSAMRALGVAWAVLAGTVVGCGEDDSEVGPPSQDEKRQASGGQDVVALIRLLRSFKTDQVEAAQRRLVGIGDAAVPALLQAVREGDPVGNEKICKTLGLIGGPAAAGLAKILESDAERHVKMSAAGGLGWAGEEGAAVASRLLGSPQEDLRYWGSMIVSMRESDLGAAVPAMTKALHDSSAVVRHQCALALGGMGDAAQKAVPALVRVLGSKDLELRRKATASLAVLEVGPEHLRAVLQILNATEDETTRVSACKILERMGPKGREALPSLRKMLEHLDERTRVAAARAVWHVGGDPGPVVAPLIASLEGEDSRFSALATLAEIGPAAKAAVPTVLLGLRHEWSEIRAEAAFALGCIGVTSKEIVDALRLALQDDDVPTRVAAATALWKLLRDGKEVVPTLVEVARGQSWPYAQAEVARLLGEIGSRDPAVIAALDQLSKHREPEPREAARDALRILRRR